MNLSMRVRVTETEAPSFGSIGYVVGEGPDGSTVRFYSDRATVRELQAKIERGETPEISVPLSQFILSAEHWASR